MKLTKIILMAGFTTAFLTGCQKSTDTFDKDPEGCIELWADNLPELTDTTIYLKAEPSDFDGYFYYVSDIEFSPFKLLHSSYYEANKLNMGQGITYLNYLDFETAGYTNQSCISTANMQKKNYFFAQCNGDDYGMPAQIDLTGSDRLYKGVSFYINNTTYVYNVIVNSDAAGRGYFKEWTKNDLLQLHIIGENKTATRVIADTITVDLARGFTVINKWTRIDLSRLDSINSIRFVMTGTDTGDYGLSTPACFCFDGLKLLPL